MCSCNRLQAANWLENHGNVLDNIASFSPDYGNLILKFKQAIRKNGTFVGEDTIIAIASASQHSTAICAYAPEPCIYDLAD